MEIFHLKLSFREKEKFQSDILFKNQIFILKKFIRRIP